MNIVKNDVVQPRISSHEPDNFNILCMAYLNLDTIKRRIPGWDRNPTAVAKN